MTISRTHAKPIGLLAYAEDTPGLLRAAKNAGLGGKVPLYVGNYGVSKQRSEQIHGIANARYAPMFSLDESKGIYHSRNYLTAEEKHVLDGRANADLAGKVPGRADLAKLSASQQVRWGTELGRRMRDQIRDARRDGAKVETWQLDEILGEASTQAPLRRFLRGVLHGLNVGRPELGDKPMRGITWLANSAMPMARGPLDQEKRRFLRTLDQASFRVVGEEYAPMSGDASAAAHRWNDGQEFLASAGKVGKHLAAKYMVGMSPGYQPGVSLGSTMGRSRSSANAWRDAFIDARSRDGVAGFAEYNFYAGNARPEVMGDVSKAVARGLKKAR